MWSGVAWGQTDSRMYQKNSRAPTAALEFFSRSSRGSVGHAPRRNMPPPRSLQLSGISKPFSNIRRQPTISPYLNLDVLQSETSLPNYYAYVRPQLQQQQTNREQQAQIFRLKQKLRSATAMGVISDNLSGGMPTTGHSSQFLNSGGYFSGVR